jgi:peptidoglycan/xylan/chitin deacetylase (PgdA/CDA1 family)
LGVIRLDLAGEPTAAERWAFETLVDLSRLVPLVSGSAGGVSVSLTDSLGGQTHFQPGDGVVQISRAALHLVVELAGAAVEQRSQSRDRHGRVPAACNPLVQGGIERTLPVQALAENLARAVATAAGPGATWRLVPWPEGRRWAAAFTHDLDVVTGWPVFAVLRWVELLRKGEIARATVAMKSAALATPYGPVAEGVNAILDRERGAGVRSTWFVLAGRPGPRSWLRGDITYRLDGRAPRRLVETILRGGHEIGLHGSFRSGASAERMAEERQLVTQVSGQPPMGVRQHFLRFDPGHTPVVALAAGFGYDATVGFADRSGFRLGVADVVSGWQDAEGEEVPLLEIPLSWMDRTMSKYLGEEDPIRWLEDATELAATCRAAGGVWVGLWHPNVTPALGFPGALDAFERLLEKVVMGGPYVAPLAELVAWRTARRGLRARIRGADIELTSDRPGHWPIELETMDGRRVATHSWPEPRHG